MPEATDQSGQLEKQSHRTTMGTRALVFLLVLGMLYTVYFARALLLPIFLAALISSLLHPIVRQLNRIKIPDSIGAIIVLVSLMGMLAIGVSQLSEPANDWFSRAPALLRNLEFKLHTLRQSLEEAKKTTATIEKMTNIGDDRESTPQPKVESKEGPLSARLFSLTQSFVVSAAVTIILIYFILARGRKTLASVAATFSNHEKGRKLLDLLYQIQKDITRYLGTITIINCVLGVVTAFTLALLSVPNPILWGVVAGVLNYIPYLGSVITFIALTVVSYLSFDSWSQILLPPLFFFCYTALEGQFVTPTILGKILVLNPIMIFISILFWSWAWGIFGVLLAVPILAALKIISKNVNSLKVLHALL